MTKRMLALILALTMLFTVLPTGYAADARVRGTTEGSCGDDMSWTLSIDEETGTGTLYIDGTGAMWDFSPEGAPWYAYRDSIDWLYLGYDICSLGAYALQDCAALSDATLPESLCFVGTGAFSGCTGLTWLSIYNPFCELDCGLSGLPESMTVSGYDGSTAVDYALEYGYAFSSLGTYQCSGFCGDQMTWRFDLGTGLLSIEGSGEMEDFEPCGAPWYQFHDRITDVYYSDETTGIGAYAFQDCTGISVFYCYGSSLTSIGAGAFSGCTGLTSIVFSERVVSVGADAFSGCTALETFSVWHPFCELNCGASGLPETMTVSGYDGSTAEAYAEQYGYSFSSIGSYTVSGSSGAWDSDVSWSFDSGSASLSIYGSGDMQWPSDEEMIAQWDMIRNHIREVYVYEGVTGIVWGVAATESWGWDSLTDCASLESLYIYSPYCQLYLGQIGPMDTLTVYGYDGSTAEEFAESYGYSFSSLGNYWLEGSLDGGSEWDRNWCLETGTGHLYVYGVSEVSCSLDTGYLQYPMLQYIRSVSFSDEVKSIAPYAFNDCSALSSVEIPSGMESVQSDAFYECSALETFIVNSFSCELLCGQTGQPGNMTVYGYDGSSAEAYAEEYGYSFSSLGSYSCSGSCGAYGSDNLQWYFDSESGTLTIYGSGEMMNDFCSPWYSIRKYIRSVSLPDGLTTVGQYAFEECTALQSIVIPESVTVIESDAFYGCTALESMEIQNPACQICCGQSGPEGVMTVYGYTGSTAETYASEYGYLFSSLGVLQYTGTCGAQGDNLTWFLDYSTGMLTIEGSGDMDDTQPWNEYIQDITKVTFPDGLTSIGNYAFSGCTGLTSVTFPAGLTSIGNYAFYGCTGLTSVTFPAGLTSIGNYAFSGCTGLTSVTFSDGLTSIGNYAFDGCTGLTEITLPDGLTSIGGSAFSGCTGLTAFYVSEENPCFSVDSFGALFNKDQSVLIQYPCKKSGSYAVPNSVSSIGNYAFYGCKGLTAVTLPDILTSIGDWAFYGCGALTEITLPDGLTKFGQGAFWGCYGLTSITLPDLITSISPAAFFNCSGLTSVTLPDGLTSIGGSAFYNCKRLTEITFPDSLKYINRSAFSDCKGLTEITLPDGLTSISESAFSNCIKLTEITLPDGLTSIGSSTFYGCTGLMSITFPSGLTSIGSYAFKGCTGLTEITLPDSLTSIGGSAFERCTGLTEIVLPASLTSVKSTAFSGCNELADLYYGGTEAQWTDLNVSVPALCRIHCSTTDPTNHWTVIEDVAPTCTEPGSQHKTCSCGYSVPIGEEIPALGHNVVNGVCTVCGLIVVSEPVITSHPESQTVGLGKYATFTVEASGEYLSYQWQYQRAGQETWKDWAGRTGATLRFKGTGTNNAYRYRCVVTNAAGSVSSEAATLTVISKPVITMQPEDATAALGSYATFTVAAAGENLSYQWQYQRAGQETWKDWAGKTGATLRFKGTSTNHAYKYRCVVTNEGGSTTSEAATLTVISKPVITTQPENMTVVLGAYATFLVEAAGDDLSYQWQYKRAGQKTWNDWAGKTSSTLTFHGTSTNNKYQYRCVVTNAAGSVTSDAAILTVIKVAVPTITSHPESAIILSGDSATFRVVASGENLEYQWQYKTFGSSSWIDLSGKTSASLIVTGTSANNGCQYRCVVSNEFGAVNSNAATLTVVAPSNRVKPELA